jgi:hypothetical protein
MDGSRLEPEDDDGDAARAFEALRAEVAALRRGVELVARQAQQGGPAAPDYSPTLGKMEQALQAIAGRLEAVERAPALAVTPADQAGELRLEMFRIGQDARDGLAHSQARLDATVGDLRGMIESALTRRDQRKWLLIMAAYGVLGGVLLWFVLTAFLPWGGGTWLAGLAYGGRWNAGQVMMRDANPAEWERMVRLYNACPRDSLTELCAAAMAVRTIAPSRPPTRDPRATNQEKP